jgi:hypothetical protein
MLGEVSGNEPVDDAELGAVSAVAMPPDAATRRTVTMANEVVPVL